MWGLEWQKTFDDQTKWVYGSDSSKYRGEINILNRVLNETPINLNDTVVQSIKEQRILWKMNTNTWRWLDSWLQDLIKLGFGLLEEDGSVTTPTDKMGQILNTSPFYNKWWGELVFKFQKEWCSFEGTFLHKTTVQTI